MLILGNHYSLVSNFLEFKAAYQSVRRVLLISP